MADIIKRHNFDQALKRIEQFSNSTPTIPVIDKFETDGGIFGWGDHYINGREMNNYVEKVQEHFSKQNSILITTIKEFKEIYHTFNFLDKEYLQGIISAVNAANKASEGAKVASNQAKDAAHFALKNEEDIRKEVEAIKKIIEKIKNIREDLNSTIAKLEDSILENRTFLNREISKITLSYSEIEKLIISSKSLTNLSELLEKVDWIDGELNENIKQFNILKVTFEENLKKNFSDLTNLRTNSENNNKTIYKLIDQANFDLQKQKEDQTLAIGNLKSESDSRHREIKQRIDQANLDLQKQKEDQILAIANLKSEGDSRHREITQQIDQTNSDLQKQKEEYEASKKTIEQSILQQKLDLQNQIELLNQNLILQHKKFMQNVIIAWIIGFIGVVISIVALII